MKRFTTLSLLLFFKITFSQNMAKINLKDSCIMTGGIIALSDFKKLCKICPPGVPKINSFIISYPVNPPLYMELRCNTNHWKPADIIKYAKPGVTFIIEEIDATNSFGQKLNMKHILIGFK